MKKVIIVGSNHAGIAAANGLLEDPKIQVSLYDRSQNVSFVESMSSFCLSHQIPAGQEIFYTDPTELSARGAQMHINTDVTHIDFENKTVYSTTQDGSNRTEHYDILILATGSSPIKLKSDEHHPIHSIKTFEDFQRIDDALDHHSIKDVVIIGGGLIGLETAISASIRQKNVQIIEKDEHLLANYFDSWISDDVLTLFETAGIQVKLNSRLDESYFVDSDSPYQHQLHIATIGVRPNTCLGQKDLDLSEDGAYLVNRHSQTSRPEVYAVGDCASAYSSALRKEVYNPRASHAIQSGAIAAQHILGNNVSLPVSQSAIGSSLLGLNIFATGVNTKRAREAGLVVQSAECKGLINHDFIDRDSYYKSCIVFEEDSRRIVGAQIASLNDISMITHMFSLAIAKECTVDELKQLEIFYYPKFNKLNSSFSPIKKTTSNT